MITNSVRAYRGDTIVIPILATIQVGATYRAHVRTDPDDDLYFIAAVDPVNLTITISAALSENLSEGTWYAELEETNVDIIKTVQRTTVVVKNDVTRDYGIPIDPTAIDDIDLGEKSLGVDSILLHTNQTGVPAYGELRWNDEEGTASIGLADGGAVDLGQEMFNYYANLDTVPIVNGDVVSIVGVNGNRSAIRRTDATDPILSLASIGVCTVQSIAPNATGRITKMGWVRELNTSAWTEGMSLYVDPLNKGKLTQVMPDAGNYIIRIGKVLVQHATQGIIDVDIVVIPKLSDLSDVTRTPLEKDGQFPVYNAAEGVFEHIGLIAVAEIHNHDTNVSQSIPAGTTYVKLTNFTDNGHSKNAIADAANDKITLLSNGIYRVEGSFSFLSDTNNVDIRASVFLGGVEKDHIHFERKIGTGTDIGNAGLTGFIRVTNAPVDLDIRARHTSVSAIGLTMRYANLNTNYISHI